MTSLHEKVAINLQHYNAWTEVNSHPVSDNLTVLSGFAPAKIDEKSKFHWVVPRSITEDPEISVQEVESWFQGITKTQDPPVRPSQLTIAIVNDDGTIVYYVIHDGVVEPRQN